MTLSFLKLLFLFTVDTLSIVFNMSIKFWDQSDLNEELLSSFKLTAIFIFSVLCLGEVLTLKFLLKKWFKDFRPSDKFENPYLTIP